MQNGSSNAGVGDIEALKEVDGEDSYGVWNWRVSIDVANLFFPINCTSFTGAYGTAFTPFGITQYANFWVTACHWITDSDPGFTSPQKRRHAHASNIHLVKQFSHWVQQPPMELEAFHLASGNGLPAVINTEGYFNLSSYTSTVKPEIYSHTLAMNTLFSSPFWSTTVCTSWYFSNPAS